jgi:hypothetical protein
VLRGDAGGDASGTYFPGEGSYRVDWLLVDEAGRTCRKQWFADADAGRGVKPAMAPGAVADIALRSSSAPPREPRAPSARHITILLDAAPVPALPGGDGPFTPPVRLPANTGESARPQPIRSSLPVTVAGTVLHPGDHVLLLGTLSALLERFPAFSLRLVVSNLDQQKELYRSDNFGPGGLDDVARTLNQLHLAKVEYRVQQNRMGHIDLLAGLINRELSAEPVPDAVVFVGPRERFHDAFPNGLIHPRHGPAPRFYFLAYQLPAPLREVAHAGERDALFGGSDEYDSTVRHTDLVVTTAPEGMPDTVSRAIAKVKGKTFTIETPKQFAKAVEEIARRSLTR